jgi:hypothetical protein
MARKRHAGKDETMAEIVVTQEQVNQWQREANKRRRARDFDHKYRLILIEDVIEVRQIRDYEEYMDNIHALTGGTSWND